jgi:hypothetical protein
MSRYLKGLCLGCHRRRGDEMKMELWVVGEELLHWWRFHGIFDKEEAAVNACKTADYFVGPVTLNEEIPDETVYWPGAYKPCLGQK